MGLFPIILLPLLPRIERDFQGVDNHHASVQGSETYCMNQITDSVSHNGTLTCGDNKNGDMGTLDRPTDQESTEKNGKEVTNDLVNQKNFPGTIIYDRMNPEFGHKERDGAFHDDSDRPGVLTQEDPWEEYGCILWDLSANKTHAELMVENLLLDVLLANLNVSKSVRITEICLGIIANLACHEGLRNLISSSHRLIETVVDQLFLDDSLCLSETFRLLALCLQGGVSVIWAQALQPEYILCRILWISENTLNPQLLEKCNELFLAIVDGQKEVVPILLPPFMKLGLPNLLVNLLACEMNKLTDGRGLERYSVLDSILCVIEALSIVDNYSKVVSSNRELFRLVYGVVRLPDKVEVASSCVTAVALIANILTDEPNLISEISQDTPFLQGLLDILPFVSDDSQARSALWSVLARVLVHIEGNAMTPSILQQYASVLIDKSDLIEEDLEDHRLEDYTDHKSSNSSAKNLSVMTTSLTRIINILNQWIITRGHDMEKDSVNDEGRVHRLLSCCHKNIM
ncbi:ARM repeat superfamily protein isoform X2 [Tasmannia lanceolata]|uniref:ARM repeat superfamily protein isoform X2 n=1 Tax=Tasmannia lanceolata TaxID=3420 RepID=UPI0040640A27